MAMPNHNSEFSRWADLTGLRLRSGPKAAVLRAGTWAERPRPGCEPTSEVAETSRMTFGAGKRRVGLPPNHVSVISRALT
jgi:hypothetical protein